jgi:hypothetical protein
MPKTAELIENLVENTEDTAIRRIEKVKNDFLEQQIIPSRTELARQSGVLHLLNQSKIVDKLNESVFELRNIR